MRAKQNITDRPAATVEQVQAMYNNAHAAAARATEHDTNAAKYEAEADARGETLVREQDDIAAADIEHARKLAAQHIEAAERKAAETRREARVQADELRRQAGLQAQAERDAAAEQRRAEELWKWTAADAAAHAGLKPPPPTTPFETVPDVSGQVDGTEAGS